MSPAYEKALAAHTEALRARKAAAVAYRRRDIGDGEFLAAVDAMREADRVFDAAYLVEQQRQEQAAAELDAEMARRYEEPTSLELRFRPEREHGGAWS